MNKKTMKETARRIWEWKGIDYLVQIAMIAVFAVAFLHFSEARGTLNQEGCRAYWHEYHPEVNLTGKKLVNATEKAWIKSGGRKQTLGYEPKIPEPDNGSLELNLSAGNSTD